MTFHTLTSVPEGDRHFMSVAFTISAIIIQTFLIYGCASRMSEISENHDPQLVQIQMHSFYHDEINTFEGVYQKDLIPGIAETKFWFTKREQEIILTKAEAINFFSFPDTIYPQPGVYIAPNFGAQSMRIKYQGKDKTVVWFEPMNRQKKLGPQVVDLRRLIMDIVYSKPEYKALPPVKGGYL